MPCHNACISRAAPHSPRPLFSYSFRGLVLAVAQFFFSFPLLRYEYMHHLVFTAHYTAQHSTTLAAWFRRARALKPPTTKVSRLQSVSVSYVLVLVHQCSVGPINEFWRSAWLVMSACTNQSPVAVPSVRVLVLFLTCTRTLTVQTRTMPFKQSAHLT